MQSLARKATAPSTIHVSSLKGRREEKGKIKRGERGESREEKKRRV